jgi:7-cyano-7-deazaguanine tRNA-ribosyltransferase
MKIYIPELERYDPPNKKSAFFYSGPESLNRPEIYRHLNKLNRLPVKKRLLLLPPAEKPYSKHIGSESMDFYSNMKIPDLTNLSSANLQIAVLDIPFCMIPLEIEEVYPLAQNEAPEITDQDSKDFLLKHFKNKLEDYQEIFISKEIFKLFDLPSEILDIFPYEYLMEVPPIELLIDDINKVQCIADYQFGSGSGKALFSDDINITKSKKTGKIRHIYDNDDLIATLRARDGVLVLGMEGARRLHSHLPYPLNRVVVNEDAEPFVKEGKSIFAKFVINCDMNIRASEEVLVVNHRDDLLAFGKSILNSPEIMNFKAGQAVKNRKGGF